MVSNFLCICCGVKRSYRDCALCEIHTTTKHLFCWVLLATGVFTHTYVDNHKRWSHAENFRSYCFAISETIELCWFGYSHWDFNRVYGYYVHLISHISAHIWFESKSARDFIIPKNGDFQSSEIHLNKYYTLEKLRPLKMFKCNYFIFVRHSIPFKFKVLILCRVQNFMFSYFHAIL